MKILVSWSLRSWTRFDVWSQASEWIGYSEERPATPKSLAHGTVRCATWVGAGLDETSASGAWLLDLPMQGDPLGNHTSQGALPIMVFLVSPRCVNLVRNLRLNRAHLLLLLRLPRRRLPFPQGHAQAVLKALKGLGLPDALLQQVHQSLAPPQKPAASKLRQLAHLDEQLKALKNRIQRQTLTVERHREQGERMQEKLLSMHVEEDKLKEEFKVLQNSPPSQCSSHPGSPVAVSAGATPPASDNGDAPMEDPFGPLPSDDDGVGVSFVENEDSSERARVVPSIAMVNKALGDRQFSKKEALKLRKQLDLFIAEDSDEEKTNVLFQNFETEQDDLSLL